MACFCHLQAIFRVSKNKQQKHDKKMQSLRVVREREATAARNFQINLVNKLITPCLLLRTCFSIFILLFRIICPRTKMLHHQN